MVKAVKRDHCGVYLKVKIYSEMEMVPGSDLRENKAGELVPVKPKYIKRWFYIGGYKEDSMKEVKKSIDLILGECKKRGVDKESFVLGMNEG
jgi:hypothetical protein